MQRSIAKTILKYPFMRKIFFSEYFKDRKFDIVCCTLFLHHFPQKDLVKLLKQFKVQSEKVIINDLHRHFLAYYSIKWDHPIFQQISYGAK